MDKHVSDPFGSEDKGNDKYRKGMGVRSKVLGEAHVERARATTSQFDEKFQSFITEGAWGSVWAGENIPLRERSMITLALLAAFGHEEEFAMHVRATANTGASEDDIKEVLMHVAVYAGVPLANGAFKIAKMELAKMKAKQSE